MSDQLDGIGSADDADVMVAHALARAVTEGGRSLLGEPRRVHGMVNDVLGADSRTRRAEVDAVVLAAEEAIPEDLLAERIDTTEAMSRLRDRGLDDAVASFAIDVWRYALGMLGTDIEPPSLRHSLETTSQPVITDPMPPSLSNDDHAAADATVLPAPSRGPTPTVAAAEFDGPVDSSLVDVPVDAPVADRRKPWWLVGSVAALVLVIVAALIVVSTGGGDDDALPSPATTDEPSETRVTTTTSALPAEPDPVTFDSETTALGSVERVWSAEDEEFVGKLSIENTSAEPVSGTYYEILPTSLAATTAAITSYPKFVVVRESPQPQGFRTAVATTAPATDPIGGVVISWELDIAPGKSAEITYRVPVDAEVTHEMLEAWRNDHLVQAQLFATERAAPPDLVITTPSGTVFTTPAVQVTGTVDPSATLRFGQWPVTVNADGTWTMEGQLPAGPNTLTFVAKSRYGVRAKAAVDVLIEIPGDTTTTTSTNPVTTGTTTPAPRATGTTAPPTTAPPTTAPPTTAPPTTAPPPQPIAVAISGPSTATLGCSYMYYLGTSGFSPTSIQWSPIGYTGTSYSVQFTDYAGTATIRVTAWAADGRSASARKDVNVQPPVPGGGCL